MSAEFAIKLAERSVDTTHPGSVYVRDFLKSDMEIILNTLREQKKVIDTIVTSVDV